jgi:hypothetical protein
LTFTANLSKKVHAENLKIFFKKNFLKKNLFWGYEKRWFWGEKIPRKKCLDHKKKASTAYIILRLAIIWPTATATATQLQPETAT